MKSGEMIPDEIIIEVLAKRLRQVDCLINGWVIDGFPSTTSQIQFLKDMNMSPSLVFVLDAPDHTVYERLEHRRFDPV